MADLALRIKRREPLLVDGAMGTMLLDRQLNGDSCPEAINLTRPQVLEDIASRYLEAGADILQTNTFGASPFNLRRYGLGDQVRQINEAAVRAVRNVCGQSAFIAGSCGPSGAMLKPHGDTEPGDLAEGFAQQLKSLIEAGVDAIIVETMIDLEEATLAVTAARSLAPSLPIFATMTFEHTPRGYFTMMGVGLEQAARGLREAGADVVGSNCGNGIEHMVQIARSLRQSTEAPLIIQSNAGLPIIDGARTTYPESPEFMADHAALMLEAGVTVIGGCCGTTPAHIKALRTMIDARH